MQYSVMTRSAIGRERDHHKFSIAFTKLRMPSVPNNNTCRSRQFFLLLQAFEQATRPLAVGELSGMRAMEGRLHGLLLMHARKESLCECVLQKSVLMKPLVQS